MTRENGTELPLQSEEKDVDARPTRGSPANTVRGTTERKHKRDLKALNEAGKSGLRANKRDDHLGGGTHLQH